MIVKKVESKKATRSSFKALADYLLDVKNNMEKVENYEFTNCSFDEINHNVMEIVNTQELNTRAKQDKTYHLVISFAEEEDPSKKVIKDIQEELLAAIGLRECQALSVVHNNTNNIHIHIAVNMINPRTLNYSNVPFDKLTLQNKAAELEIKHNLKITNHIAKTIEERSNDIDDKTIHTGMTNFKEWVKQTADEDIKKVLANKQSTLEDLYKVLAKYNLELRDRGNGSVIADRTQKLFIKASDVNRELSKEKIDKRYGKKNLEALRAITDQIKPIIRFGKQTVLKSQLWDEYKKQQQKFTDTKRREFAKEKIERKEELQQISLKWKLQREKIMKNRTIAQIERKKLYRTIKENREKEINTARENYKEKRDAIFTNNKTVSFKDFLIEKALNGDSLALKALRKTKYKTNPEESILSAKERKEDNKIFSHKNKTINKDGTVTYRINEKHKIIDKGDYLKVDLKDNGENEILTFLNLAIAKYGKDLDINGTNEFKREVLKVANKNNLKINFKDSIMRDIQKAQEANITL